MILKVFILVLVVEIIANKPPSQYWAGGPMIRHPSCQPAKIFWCSRHGVHPDPWLYISDPDYYGPKPMPIFFGPFFPIPPVKCGPFVPIPPVKCGPSPIIPPVKRKKPYDPDSGCGPEPYSPRDPTRPKAPGKRLLPYCLSYKINQMTQLHNLKMIAFF